MMTTTLSTWQTLSERVVNETRPDLASAGACALAFHSVADGYVRLNSERLDRFLSAVERPADLLKREPPETLRTVEDVVTALLWGLQTGHALQRMIERPELHQWLLQEIGYDRPVLGGTSANMALSLASLGIDPVIVYAYPPSRRVASLFPANESLQTYTTDPNPRRVPLARLAEHLPEEEPHDAPLHWIFEYDPQLSVDVGAHGFRPPRANRFIAGWNPANRQLRLEDAFVDGLLRDAAEVRFFFLSGYHILAGKYPDGTDCRAVIAPTAQLARQLKQQNPNVRRHLELASIGSTDVRKEVLHQVFPHVDSVGLNEVELETYATDLGMPFETPGSGTERLTRLYEACHRLHRHSGVTRIHLHDLTNYLVIHDDGPDSPRATRDALLFASAAAARRARTGHVSVGSAQAGLQEPISPDGLARLHHLDMKLRAEGATKIEPGIWKAGPKWVIAVPHRVVPQPKFTVGLGDLISSAAYVAESIL